MQNTLTKFDCGADAIAIIGISCRLPGGITRPAELWQALLKEQCLVSEVPADRFSTQRFAHAKRETKGHSVTFKAGIVGDVSLFDAACFKMGRLEAQTLDPQQRLALEMSYEAFESAGLKPSTFKGSDTAVFIGAASTDMAMCRADDACAIGPYSMTGTNLSIISNRLSYFYDLHGPSMTIDTACSSSLTALHQACEALRHHRCSAALAGGVNILLSPLPFVGFSQAHMLSPSGRCKVFAADADGYVRAEGGGIVLLKRLGDAMVQGDNILGIIEDSAVNQDGRTSGIALPSEAAQSRLLQSIYAGKDLSSLVYLEAHGTGTAAGDPIECRAAGKVLGSALELQQGRELYIGSVKSNVGHLETGSGMAGLVKALLLLQHETITAQLYADNLNPKIDFAALNLKVNAAVQPFPKTEEPALIGLNSFGFGGSNAHALLRRFDADFTADCLRAQGSCSIAGTAFNPPGSVNATSDVTALSDASVPGAAASSDGVFLLLSAASDASLVKQAAQYADFITHSSAAVTDIATAVYQQRDVLVRRLGIKAQDKNALVQALHSFAANGTTCQEQQPGAYLQCVPAAAQGKLALVFSGNGAQYPGMGYDLYRNLPGFAAYFDEIAAELSLLQDIDFAALIQTAPQDLPALELDFNQPTVAQPFIFAIEAALARVLQDAGLKPAACCGHSVGEVAAAYIAGRLSLQDACLVIVKRSWYQATTSTQGGMAAVKLPEKKLNELLQQAAAGGAVATIAAHNAPDSFTLSGIKSDLTALGKRIKAAGGAFKLLQLNFAFHSALMDEIKVPLLQALATLNDKAGTLDFYSSAGSKTADAPVLDGAYWWHNIRDKVEFYAVIDKLLQDGYTQFIEVGPRAILTSYVKQIAAASERSIAADSLQPSAPAEKAAAACQLTLLRALTCGMSADLSRYFKPASARITLPFYPFSREHLWPEHSTESFNYFNPQDCGALLGNCVPFARTFINELDVVKQPYFAGHQVQGEVLLPFAAFLLLVKQAGEALDDKGRSMRVLNLELSSGLKLSGGLKRLRVEVSTSRQVTIAVRDFAASAFNTIATARTLPFMGSAQRVDLAAVQSSMAPADPAEVYALAEESGISYQGEYRRIKALYCSHNAVLACLDMHHEAAKLQISPAGLDGALQLMFCVQAAAKYFCDDVSPTAHNLYLPSSCAEFALDAAGATELYAHFKLVRANAAALTTDIDFYTQDGRHVGFVKRCRYLRVPQQSAALGMFYRESWQLLPQLAGGQTVLPTLCQELKQHAASAVADDDSFSGLFNAAMCALTGKLIAKLNPALVQEVASLTTDAAADAAAQSAEEIFGLFLDDKAQGLAQLLLTHCCAFGFGRQLGSDLYVLDVAALTKLDFTALQNAMLEHYPAENAPLQLLTLTAESFPALAEQGDCTALKLCDYLAERLLDFDDAKLRLRQALVQSLAAGVDLLPSEQSCQVLEICTTPTTLLHPAALSEAYASGRLHMLRVAVNAPTKAALEGKPNEVAVEGRALPRVLSLSELQDELRANKLACDVVLINELTLTPLDAAALTQLAALIAAALKPNGSLLLLQRADNAKLQLLHVLKQLQAGAANEALQFNVQFGTYLQACGLTLDDTLKFSALNVQLFKAAATAQVCPQEEASAYGLYLSLNSPSDCAGTAAEPPTELRVALQTAGLPLVGQGDQTEQELSPAAAFISLNDKKAWRQYVNAQHHVDNLGSATLVLDARQSGFSDAAALAPLLYQLKETLLKAKRLGFSHYCVIADGTLAACLQRGIKTDAAIKAADAFLAQLSPAEQGYIASGAVRALLRTAAAELKLPGVKLILAAADVKASALAAEITAHSPRFSLQEVLLSAAGRWGCMLDVTTVRADSRQSAATAQRRVLSCAKPGRLSALHYQIAPMPELKPDEVLLEVKASGLNFRDVLWASGMLPDEALESGFAGASLGLECSGIVRAVGAAVDSVHPGDAVMAFGSACLSSQVITKDYAVLPKPKQLSFAQAAALPVVFFTAYYAICVKAQAERGESILIHGAAGGVGLAAVQIAKALGLKVYATAGSPVKRALLTAQGADAVFNSRSLDFADALRAATQGQGVDIVLNSLYDDAAALSLQLLRPCGRFIELGKRDFYADHALFLKAFKDNLTYCGVDADELLNLKPQQCARIMRQLCADFAAGTYQPIACNLYPQSAAVRAFYDLRSASGIGKLVIVQDETARKPAAAAGMETCAAASSVLAKPEAAAAEPAKQPGYALISGGLGGLGQAVVKHLAAQGWQRFILIGRRSRDEVQAQLTALADSLNSLNPYNCSLCYVSADAADMASLQQGLNALTLNAPITLICHAAGILQDGMLPELTAQSFATELQVKLKGALNLTAACQVLNTRLEAAGMLSGIAASLQCAFFSSVAALMGNPGQGNYAAANGALEAFAEVLAARGLSACAIGWGPVAEVGMLAGKEQLTGALERRLGTAALTVEEVCRALQAVLSTKQCGSRWFFKCNWQRIAAQICSQEQLQPICSRFELHLDSADAADTAAQLRTLSGSALEEALLQIIIKEASRLVGTPASELSAQVELSSLGMDSLSLMELTVRLSDLIKLNLSPEYFAACRTLGAFARTLARLLQGVDESALMLETMQEQHGVALREDLAQESSALLGGAHGRV